MKRRSHSEKKHRMMGRNGSRGYYGHRRKEMEEFVPPGARRILDAGCGEGAFAMELKRKTGAEVWGIEIDESSEIASQRIDKVIHGDIAEVLDGLPERYFDCVIFNDVLEHLVDPHTVLERLKSKIAEGGVMVCSLPNVGYHKVMRNLVLRKQWRYTDEGILDRTHLRFFTRESMVDMLKSAGYEILLVKGLHKTRSRNFRLLNMILFNFFSDALYAKFACVARPLAERS